MWRTGKIGQAVVGATMFLGASTADSAITLSKSQYVSLWTNACAAGGRSSKLKLSSDEKSVFAYAIPSAVEGYRSGLNLTGQRPPPLSAMIRSTCGCMARHVASHKKNLDSPTSSNLLFAALDKCLGAR